MDLRKQFPFLQRKIHGHPLIYLDSAATAQKPLVVIEALRQFYAEEYATVHRAIYSGAALATEKYQETRKKLQQFLNSRADDEIIFTKGATEAINLVAHSFGKAYIKPGDLILVSEMEHHSNIVPWQLCAEERGAKIIVIPFLDSGELDLTAYRKLLQLKPKMVAITHVSNTLGIINPIQELVKEAHEQGAYVLVDGAQSAPHMPINVQELGCDFFVLSGHKLFGPSGIGVLYGKKELLDNMPPYQGGGDMVDVVTFEKTTYAPLPLKFEAGTPPIASVVALGKAIDFLQEIGMQKIQAIDSALLDCLYHELLSIPGMKILGGKKGRTSLVTFTIDGVHPLDLATFLDLQGIAIRSGSLCAQPALRHYGCSSASRASLAFYNTEEEIAFFGTALRKITSQLK